LCTSPLPLFADGGTFSIVSGTTAGAASNYSACLGSGGPDVVYSFSTTGNQKLTARVTPTNSDLQPVVYLREATACQADAGLTATDGGLANYPGCMTSQWFSYPANLVSSNLPAGDYLLFVDSNSSAANRQGAFSLEARLSAPDAPATNDTCATAEVLNFTPIPNSNAGSATLSSSTRGVANDHAGSSCATTASAAGNDVVYRFTTPTTPGPDGGVMVRATVTSENMVEYLPALYLRTACATDAGEQLGCNNTTSSPYHTVVLAGGLLPSTDYYLWVDTSSTTASQGPFSLRVDVAGEPPPNDTCTGAIPLPLNTSVAGTTLAANNDYTYSGAGCSNSLPGPDVVYTFTTTTAGTYTVRVLPERGFDVGLAVQTGTCGGTLTCVATADPNFSGQYETIVVNATAATTYYVMVDSWGSSITTSGSGRGGFVVSVSQ
jgi:hypothetical protein